MGFRLTPRRGVGHRDVINHTQVNTPKSVFESSNGHEAESVWIFQRERERETKRQTERGERETTNSTHYYRINPSYRMLQVYRLYA